MKITGQTALVTGSGKGIGRAIAKLLARNGVKIVVNALHEESADGAAREITEEGYSAIALAADVSDQQAVNHMVDEAERHWGRSIDILVNNAAAAANFIPFGETTLEIQRDELVTLLGVFNCTRAVLPGMVKAGCGRIINISSISGTHGTPGRAIYSAANAGIEMFSRALAMEVGQLGITVNCVNPGATESPRFKARTEELRRRHRDAIALDRFAEPEDVAKAVLFLASDMANYITSAVIGVDGGFAGYPPFKDRLGKG